MHIYSVNLVFFSNSVFGQITLHYNYSLPSWLLNRIERMVF